MEELVAGWLRDRYADVLVEQPMLHVPIGWSQIAFDLLDAARALGPRVRVDAIVRDGAALFASLGWSGDPAEAPDAVWDQMGAVVEDASERSRHACIIDGRPGWSVETRRGPEVLCEMCQQEQGIRVDIERRPKCVEIKCDES